jgi:hypothetical protein
MLANAIATKGFSVALGIAKIQQSALNKAVKANPYVFAASVLTTLVTALGLFASNANKAKREQASLNEELRRGKELQGNVTDIEERIQIYEKLNQTQKAQLQSATQGTLEELNVQKASIQVYRDKDETFKQNLIALKNYGSAYKKVNQSTFEGKMEALRLAKAQQELKEKMNALELEKFGITYDEVTGKIRRYNKLNTIIGDDLKKNKKGQDDYTTSLDDTEKKLLSLEKALALEDDTLAKLSEKISQVKKNRDLLVINSEEYKLATKELTALQEKQRKATAKSVDGDKKKVDSIADRIIAEQTTIDVLSKVAGYEDEVLQSQLKLKQMQIDQIIKQGVEEGFLSKIQIANLQALKGEVEGLQQTLQAEDGMSNFAKAFYGEDVQMALAGLSAGLSTIQQMGQGQAELDRVNTENKIYGINQEREEAIKNLEESSSFKVLSQEDQDAKLLELNAGYDTQANKLRETQFNKQKQLDKSEAKISGALAIMRIWSGKITGNPVVDAIIKLGMIGVQIGNTNKQIQAINATQFRAEHGGIVPEKFAKGGMVKGPRHAQGGVKFAVGGQVAELEGGEAVINRRSTAMFRGQLSAMNEAGGGTKFADGGTVAIQNQLVETSNRSIITEQDVGRIAMALGSQRVTLLESDVTTTQETVSILESRAEF